MTSKFHNIFSSRKKENKETPKPKVTIDYREKNSLVVSELVKLGFEIEIKELKVADYLVKDVAIERKTVSDFISSMTNQRLRSQLEELQQYPNKLLIIEGIEEQELYSDDDVKYREFAISVGLHERNRPSEFRGKLKKTRGLSSNSIRGFLLSILLKYKIPIIFTKNSGDTAKFISVLSRKQENEAPINPKKKSFNKKEQMQFVLEGFPGIGPKTAKKLLEEFKTIKNIINASDEELKKILGIKSETFSKLVGEEY